MAVADVLLTNALATQIAGLLLGSQPGHCVRVDDVNADLARNLADALSAELPEAEIRVLRSDPSDPIDISAERAIEIRNRKRVACVLIVPAGEGHAASSLDNSFRRVPVLTAYSKVEDLLREQIDDPQLRALVARNRSKLRGKRQEAWVEFLSQLAANPTELTFGRNLWRLGLVPDLGSDPGSRLDRNALAVRAISSPSRPASAMDERFTVGGLQEGPWRGPLRRFCDSRGAVLANARIWTREISEEFQSLSFDKWWLAESVVEDVSALEVVPFIGALSKVETWSKLKLGGDGQLMLLVPEDATAPVTVRWRTTPQNVSGIAKWILNVQPPEDLRTESTEPLSTTTVNGDKRQGTLRVSLDEDSLSEGTRFVVSVQAIGPRGEPVVLSTGTPAAADSQEFQIVGGPAAEVKTRRSAAVCIPEAVLRAAVEGLDDLTEDLVSWDLPGQVFALRLGNRRSVQVRVCEPLIRMQRDAAAHADRPVQFRAQAAYGTPIDYDAAELVSLNLPPALKRARSEFLSALSASQERDTVESAQWTDELRRLASVYAASYKRALDGDQSLDDLLRMDTLALSIRRSSDVIDAVVVLPTHPLRALWVASHDRILRSWADEAVAIASKGARQRAVDMDLVSQLAPANLPFTIPTPSGRIAVYSEELTFGAGLYIVPSDIDSEAVAEAVASVLDLPRTGAAKRSTSHLIRERIRAYEAAHTPGEALRVLAVNPGSGDLVASALTVPVTDEPEDRDVRRLEILAYSDSPSYTRPVSALADLQRSMRLREFSRKLTHLAPPVSLAVRPVDRLAVDEQAAHVAIVQDVGAPEVGFGRDPGRRPTFQDLLVPLVTSSVVDNGRLVWNNAAATGATSGGSDDDLSVVHRSHQRAVARWASIDDGRIPTVKVELDAEHQGRVRAAHDRADWVIGVDRFVGVDLYESGNSGLIGESYILDYAPDFVEGVGDRLTVTTSDHGEVEALLEDAMRDLGLADVAQSVGNVLSTLSVVSGRLALRLLENSNHAREAVSLAAVITHLRSKGELDGLIVVPVDAHPEIFGVAARDEGTARRCDLLLVRVGQRSFKIECVEVKSRKDARLPQLLAEHIVDQLEDTKRVLEARFFASDPPRIDQQLQLARLASVLHYYADRSVGHGHIAQEKVGDIHRYIDRVTDMKEPAEIALRGYVISLDGDAGFQKKYGDVPLTVLTADDLGRVGFTTAVLPVRDAPTTTPESASTAISGSPDTGGAAAPTFEPGTPDVRARVQTPADRSLALDAASQDTPGQNQPRRSPLPADATPTGPAVEDDELRAPEAVPPAPGPQRGADHEVRSTVETGLSRSAGQTQPASTPSALEVLLGKDQSAAAVEWRLSTQGSPHAFILGIPGQGKSVTTRRIIRSFADQGLPSLVFDFHGDMAAEPPAGAAVLDAAVGLPFSPFEADVRAGRPIATTAWEISEIVAYVTKLGEIQRNSVYDALLEVYGRHGWRGTTAGADLPSMSEFAASLEDAEQNARGRNARQRLRPMTDFGLFQDDASGAFDLLANYGGGVVIDLSSLGLEEVQIFAASFILRKIYREMFKWTQDHTMKLAVVLDEAHRMAKDVTLPKLMKEGRKYGVSVVVASQNADDFHRDVLGNAGAKIVFRTNHPASRGVAGFLRGRGGADLSQEIEKLGVGVAYVSTPDNPQARKTYMDE